MEIFEEVEITIHVTRTLQQVPSYVNFLKKFNKKRKSPEEEIIEVQSNCSVILHKALPPKAKDPGSFNIPCTIGSHEIGKALIDLGSSINLMPLYVFEKIGGLEVKPTKRKLLKISWCGDRKENTKIKVGIGLYAAFDGSNDNMY
ncbi:uncharacterized protein LOC124843566 [Vigna umbellata]|uniref:uncharacterized protein LOC124843566 n=1 Tax=Vigna umbellata TaxID=87088 RepID=UPI001F5F9D28|nr:uncharacterized protein LOC124843566 [Vigna umbellata]